MGPSVTREILKKLSGTILVNSQEGSGTQISVEIPNARPW
jgi:signal transduction histidine kinase